MRSPGAAASRDPTRRAALHVVAAVLDHHRTIDAALAECDAPARDRAAGHRLAAAVLRRTGTLDAVLEPWLRRAPPDEVRHILRIGAAGLLLLDVPPHAAVATGVSLARERGLDGFTGLINAVLRKVASAGAAVLETLDSPRLDTPGWLWASWGARARAIAVAHQREAPLDLTMKPGCVPPDGAMALSTGSVRLPAGTVVGELAGFQQGAFWVQDAAAALAVQVLAPGPGEMVVDLCAAPGGKTAQIAAAGARAIAVERDAVRLGRLRANLDRLRLEAECVEADAIAWRPDSLADAVLLDAPCSATGTIRRHPDVPHLKRPRDLPFLMDQQDRLLAHAHGMLKPGGRLVYSVCSLQPEEGEARVARAVASGDWEPMTATVRGLAEAQTAAGSLATHPGLWPEVGGMDGFFVALLRRVEPRV